MLFGQGEDRGILLPCVIHWVVEIIELSNASVFDMEREIIK
jgi:hypothetical protein